MPEELRLIPRAARVPSPTLRDFVAVLFRQRRLVQISFLAVLLGALLYGAVLHPYRAEMKVLVQRGRLDPVITSTPSQAELVRPNVTEEDLNSEAELLRDHEILRTVAQNSGLLEQEHSWFRELTGDSEEQRLARVVRRIGKNLDVEPGHKASVITVSYKSSDPAQAAKVLRALSAAYLERHQRVHRPSGMFSFFEQQVAQSRRGLEDAETVLMDFGHNEGVVSAAAERDNTLQKLSEADADAQHTRVSIAETVQRIRTLEAKLKVLPERTTTQIRNLDNPELLEKMKSRLLELQLKRTELLTKYAPTYRLVQEVEQEITETKAAIAAQDQTPLRDQTSDREPNHEWVKSELVRAEVEMSTLGAHAEAERNVLAGYREAAQRLSDRAVEQEALLQNLKAAEEKYLLYLNKREEARIGDALDQGGILNVMIVEPPTVPALPEVSELGFGLIGVVLAGAFSTGLAFAADHMNPSFRTPDEVMAYLGAPVLASLPRKNG